MMTSYTDTTTLLTAASAQSLYPALVEQLNKDLKLANLEYYFEQPIAPSTLKKGMEEVVVYLIEQRFTDYLNLLYIIDVPEELVRGLDGTDVMVLSEQLVFLILKREFQKVWYKNKYA